MNYGQTSEYSLTENHYIDSTDVLEYRIRFQNTGTAPAQKVIITDTISEYLDIVTFNPMSSSHACEIDFPQSNVIRWTFEDINLPDINANEPESHGFVKYKIHQQPGNEISTEITNCAAIYFDYNPPVITNEVLNTIADMRQIFTHEFVINEKNRVEVFPNPASTFIKFVVDTKEYDIELYDAYGRIIRHIQNIRSSEYTLSRNGLHDGVYFYRISNSKGVIANGKLIIKSL